MSWNGGSMLNPPNWRGNSASSGGGANSIGDLYIVPEPSTIEENPKLGLEGRNEIDLPTSYKDLNVKNLTAENFNGQVADVSKWSEYPAIHDVVASTNVFGDKLFDLVGFRDVVIGDLRAEIHASITGVQGGTIEAELEINTPVGNITTGNIAVVNTTELNVDGGATLDGGLTHGTTIGCLPVSGVNTIRVDVLPVGIDMVSATYIEAGASVIGMTSAGALTLVSGGICEIAGGDRVEINTDEIRVINTTSGNDFTDLNIGNVHPAVGGSLPLRINDNNTGRGVEIQNGTIVESKLVGADVVIVPQYTTPATWDSSTTYGLNNEVAYSGLYYRAVASNRNCNPTGDLFSAWVSGNTYEEFDFVEFNGAYFFANTYISGSTTDPDQDPSWTSTAYTQPLQLWFSFSPLRQSIAFAPASDPNYLTLVKPVGSNVIKIVQRQSSDDAYLNEGTIFDSTFNPPPFISTATANLDMNGFDIVNADGVSATLVETENVDIPQTDVIPAWATNTTYNPNDEVVANSLKYVCLIQNQNVPPAGPVPTWISNTAYVVNDITTIGGGINYKCILSYAGGTTTPNLDTTHWLGIQNGDVTIFWSQEPFVINSVRFPAEVGDTSYWNVVKYKGQNGLYSVAINETTGAITSSGRIYNEGDFPLPPFDPSIQTDLNMNGNDILNVGKLFVGTLEGTIGGQLVMDSGFNMNLYDIEDANYIGVKGIAGSPPAEPTIQLKTSADVVCLEIAGSDGTGDAVIQTAQGLSIVAAQGIDIGGNLNLLGTNSIENVSNLETEQIEGKNGNALILGTGIAGNQKSIGNLNLLEVDTITGNGGNGVLLQPNVVVQTDDPNTLAVCDFKTSGGNLALTIGSLADNSVNGKIVCNGALNVVGQTGIDIQSNVGGIIISAGDANQNIYNLVMNAENDVSITAVNTLALDGTTIELNAPVDASENMKIEKVNPILTFNETAGLGETGTLQFNGSSFNLTSSKNIGITAPSGININSSLNLNNNSMTGLGTFTPTGGTLSLLGNLNLNNNNLQNVNNITGTYATDVANKLAVAPQRVYRQDDFTGVNRAANTAEIQINQLTMTLKARTQYQINISYNGLVQNAGTATPNNNWYFIVRVHTGTTPLDTTNMLASPSIFNNTAIGGGFTTCFSTGLGTTYTMRWYIRNQHPTIALTIPTLQTSVVEVQ